MNHDQPALDTRLLAPVSETLENLAFRETTLASFHWATIPVTAPIHGTLTVRFPATLLRDLAATIWNRPESGFDTTLLEDITAELANTMAGRILSALLPDSQPFVLGVPLRGSGALPPCGCTTAVCHYETDGRLFAVCLDGPELIDLANRQTPNNRT